MSIFEEYIQMIDSSIDARICEEYEKNEIQAFYDGFKGRAGEYETLNSDTFELLYNTIDFDLFKRTMLRFKQGMISDIIEKTTQQVDLGSFNEEKFYKLHAENHDEKFNWRKMIDLNKNPDEFTGAIFQKPTDDCAIDTLQMVLTIKNVKVEEWLAVHEDGPPVKNAAEKRKVKDLSENESLLYILVKLPMMDPRDMLVKRTIRKLENGEFLHLIQSVLDDDVPIRAGTIRG